jgi:alkylhydroperoxidase/carboxymuconolactone decarboxylase family protein YurZ
MNKNPYEIFQMECPELAAKFNELIEVQRSIKGIDQKTKQLINIAIQTSNKNSTGVKMHAIMAKNDGASREEVLGAVTMNLHLSGLLSVLECLPSAIEGYDEH